MDIKIIPSQLKGTVSIPASKSILHRMLICSALSDGTSEISNITISDDIKATAKALTAMGAKADISDRCALIKGISDIPEQASIDCRESGSTLRFIIPIVAALGISCEFFGHGKLPERPITPYIREFSSKGICFEYNNTMPFNMSGKLKSGTFTIEGDISSQFITGLLFALPILDGDSEIVLSSPLQSVPYVNITLDCLRKHGIDITEKNNNYYIKGNQKYLPYSGEAEGDFSQAAFFLTANALGSDIETVNLNDKSVQGDKKILEILSQIGYNKYNKSKLRAFSADVSNIPDLVPILAVLACFCDGTSELNNAARLRIKESDRLHSVTSVINSLGGCIEEYSDRLVIHPVEYLSGGKIDSFGDHRIVMSAAVASTRCREPVIICNAEAVQKSYPGFFDDFNNLGGNSNVIHLES